MKPRKILLLVIIVLAMVVLSYFVCAFAYWDTNPKHWSIANRAGMLAFGLFVGIALAGLTQID